MYIINASHVLPLRYRPYYNHRTVDVGFVVDNATNSNIFSEQFILNLPITIRRRGTVGVVTMLRTGRPNYRGSISPVAQICLFSRTSRPALESTKPPIQFALHVITFHTYFPSQKCVQLYLQSPPTSLGAFAKLQKATISYVMSVCPHGTIRLPLNGFSIIFDYFSKICPGNSSFIKT